MKFTKIARIAAPLSIAALALTGCSAGAAETAEDYPSRTIQIIVPFSAGGGTDLGARQLMPLVEEELGANTEIQVVNKPGAGGWVGWQEIVNADPDGYTLSYLNSPNLMAGYLNPSMGRDNTLDDFTFIANQVTDAGSISIRKDENRFSDLTSLIEYAKKHELTTTTTGEASDDHISALKLNKQLGTKFKPVHTKGAANGKASFLGGHIDVLFTNVGESYQPHKQGELEVVGVMSKERSEFLPDVPTIKEAGFGPIYSSSSRGIGAPADLPEGVHQELAKAFKAAINSKEHKKLMDKQGLEINYLGPEDYKTMIKQEEADLKELSPLLGWNQ